MPSLLLRCAPLLLAVGCSFDASVGGGGAAIDGAVSESIDSAPGDPPIDAAQPIFDAAPGQPDAAFSGKLGTSGAGQDTSHVGGNGGGVFARPCTDGRVIVGFDASDNDFGLCQFQAFCASLSVIDGQLSVAEDEQTAIAGSETDNRPLSPIRCPAGSVVTGFSGTRTGPSRLVHSVSIQCTQVSWDGDIVFGATSESAVLGTPSGSVTGPHNCGPGRVAGAFAGQAGTLLDRVYLRCFDLIVQ